MNHAVLYIRDLEKSVGFYRDVLDFRGLLLERGALVGATDHGTTKGIYAHDPDGLEFEVCWLVPADLLSADGEGPPRPLDLAQAKAKYGATTRGGVGISFPAQL